MRALTWKTVDVGKSTRSDVEQRFKPTRNAGERATAYSIDRIDTTITYDAQGKVESIRVPPATALSAAALRERFEASDDSRQMPDGATALEYQRAGLVIEYASGRETPAAIEIRLPTKPPDDVRRRWSQSRFRSGRH
jgi:hypothetical protein